MNPSIEQRLHQLGLTLPTPPRAGGAYAPAVVVGNLLFVSAQFPIVQGALRHTGQVGSTLTVAEGRAAAQLAALNVLAQIQAALGGFDRLVQLARVEGHVACAPGFREVPHVLDAASAVFNDVLGPRGVHARSAFTPERLPLDLAVELVVTAVVLPAH